MKWLDSLKAAVPGLLASPGIDNADVSQSVLIDDAASNVRQVAIIGQCTLQPQTPPHVRVHDQVMDVLWEHGDVQHDA